jgi:isopenicillin N synthase-like dioxygenase
LGLKIAMQNIPIIDFQNYETNKDKISSEIKNACENVGFFYVINHGVDQKLIDEVFNDMLHFFSLPTEVHSI